MTDITLQSKIKFKPRDYQEPIIKAIIDWCKISAEPAFVDISVGGGKTALYAFVANHVIEQGLKRGKESKVLILARQGELVKQNSDFAWKAGFNNSVYSSSLNRKSTHYPIVYGTEGTVARQLGEGQSFGFDTQPDGNLKFKWVPDLLMIDENHQVNFKDPENQYMKLINFFRTANPKLRIIGGTGSPIRGKEYIVGEFWKKRLYELPTSKLVEWGWLVPPVFGFPDDQEGGFDFSSISVDKDGDKFSDDELNKIVEGDPTKTHKIMREIIARTQDRLGVLIFMSTKKHCKEGAEVLRLLAPDNYAIITDSTGYKERSKILAKSRCGEIKFLLNVGVLSTGYNNPYIDVICYLRPLDSLTLLIQTIGRGLRIPENDDTFTKVNCLVLDYGDVFARLGDLYENPILEDAIVAKAKKDKQMIPCPECEEMNSLMSRRCVGRHEVTNNRCEYFFSFRACPECETKNDPCARECRSCKCQLIDPNEKLNGKHYTENDLINVVSGKIMPCKNNGVYIIYNLENGDVAKEFFSPFSSNSIARRIWRSVFVKQHIPPSRMIEFNAIRTNAGICDANIAMLPKQITHRISDKGKSIIHRRVF